MGYRHPVMLAVACEHSGLHPHYVQVTTYVHNYWMSLTYHTVIVSTHRKDTSEKVLLL